MLVAVGYEVELFDSAVAFLAREPFRGWGCIVLDLQMPKMNGLQFQAELNNRRSSLPVVFLSAHGDIPASVMAMRQGAINFLTKPVRAAQLLAAVDSALDLRLETLKNEAAVDELRERFGQLTSREQEVCLLVAQGLPNKQIAHELGVAEATVKIHRARVLSKMKAASVADLVRLIERLKPETTGASSSN